MNKFDYLFLNYLLVFLLVYPDYDTDMFSKNMKHRQMG